MFKKSLAGLFIIFFGICQISRPAEAQELRDQVISDLVTVGISAAATATGNIPLALGAGVLSKYISTYGVQGVKALINKMRGEVPQDLGEINIYYIYLIHFKRNLYQTMINMRANLKEDSASASIVREIESLENELSGNCSGRCELSEVDNNLVNFEFMNIALDARQSFNISEYISSQQVKATYQYLMLIYLDLILVEQKLLEGQYNVIAKQISEFIERLDGNAYISNEEKEYAFQLGMNITLKWQIHRDNRRAMLLTSLKGPLSQLRYENESLESEINGYRELNDSLKVLGDLL